MQQFITTEFDILKLLWRYKQLSGREIHEKTCSKTKWAYSTTRTVVERMVKKDFLSKEVFHGLIIYKAKLSKVKVFASQISVFADKILERDAEALLPLFAKSEALSEEEIAELRDLLQSKESEK
ncbi:BlaI/MecI/CopY family transcriptional regulator [bacterium]|nr:BlaI/MecI/CopY family transcriptional regulator [bacterium]